MPTLDLTELQALRARPARICEQCHRAVAPNYCRRCDEYFESGHLVIGGDAPHPEGTYHDDHRTY